jgi:hypothetical protein
VSRRDLLKLPAGNVGIAAGLEARRESQLDDRDSGIDGTVNFVDPITNVVASNFVPNSINPDTHGTREVFSLYGELAIPAISPDMHVPLIHNLEFQAAGRFESYSDFGPVAVPKFAGAWDIVKGIRFRASWPNPSARPIWSRPTPRWSPAPTRAPITPSARPICAPGGSPASRSAPAPIR